MARPNNQAQRREEILSAAIGLIERHDLATLRIGDVAAELGLTANAVRYYFKDIEELLTALVTRTEVRFYDRRLSLVESGGDACAQLAQVIATGLPTGPDDAEWRAISRAVFAAGFELDQRHDVQVIFHRQVSLYVRLLAGGVTAGVFTPVVSIEDIATTLMSLEDYVGYRIVARDPLMSRDLGLRLMRQYAELATGATLPPAG